MSDILLPTLPGLKWDVGMAPEFSTLVQQSANFTERRVSLSATPRWRITMTWELLRAGAEAELQALAGFFMARRGRWDSWLWAHPDDSTATLQAFGTGDGTTQTFQLQRTFGVFTEPTKNVAAGPSIYTAGVLQASGYTISSTGLVTFSSAPTAGQALTWSGTYYYRCRWADDAAEFNAFMRRLYESRELSFYATLGRQL